MSIALPPIEAPELSDTFLADIAAEFQAQLQAYRLDWLHNRIEFAARSSTVSDVPLRRGLFASVQCEPAIVQLLLPHLEAQDEQTREQRLRNPTVVIVEAVWGPAHNGTPVSVTEVARRVNAILRYRDVTDVYSPREIGWKLRQLQLPTSSNGRCKIVKFTDEIRRRVHRLAHEFGLQLPPVAGCVLCGSDPIE